MGCGIDYALRNTIRTLVNPVRIYSDRASGRSNGVNNKGGLDMKLAVKTLVVLFTLLFLTFSVYSPLLAESQEMEAYPYPEEPEEASGIAMVFDFLVIRPLSVPACVLGTGMFLVTTPLTVPLRQVRITAKKLVVNPFRFTFQRPLGDLDWNPEEH